MNDISTEQTFDAVKWVENPSKSLTAVRNLFINLQYSNHSADRIYSNEKFTLNLIQSGLNRISLAVNTLTNDTLAEDKDDVYENCFLILRTIFETKDLCKWLNDGLITQIYSLASTVLTEAKSTFKFSMSVDIVLANILFHVATPMDVKSTLWSNNFTVPLWRNLLNGIPLNSFEKWSTIPDNAILDTFLSKYSPPSLNMWVLKFPKEWKKILETFLEQKGYPVSGQNLPNEWLISLLEK